MKKLTITFFTFLLLCQINFGQDNKNQPEVVKYNFTKKELTPAEKKRKADIPHLKVTNSLKALPSKVNNAELPFFPGVGSQCCCCCSQWSSHHYTFTYEMNCARNQSATSNANRYPAHYTFSFVNGGSGTGTERFIGWEASKSNGCPTIETYEGNCYVNTIDDTKWMNGYNKYYSAMHNKTDQIYYVDVSTEEGINTLKQWLHNHADGSQYGGIANFSMVGSGPSQTLPSGTEEAGKKVWTSCQSDGHSVTCVGYNDLIRYDVNNDGQYTNNIDITNDGIVDVRDWEIGGIIMVNSFGTSWGDNGYSYMLYRALALPKGSGINANRMEMIRVKKDYTPLLTYKANISHTKRNDIKITAGVAKNLGATEPEFVHEFHVFNYQGGSHPMEGEGGSSTIEIGLDVTPLLQHISNGEEVKFFLNIDNLGSNGTVNSFSLMDYNSGSLVETASAQSNVNLGSGVTRLSVNKTITLNNLNITTSSLPNSTPNSPYSTQLQASGGTSPYEWRIDHKYTKSTISSSYPNITGSVTPNGDDNGFVDVNLQFDFPLFDKTFNKASMSTNGFVGFFENNDNITPYTQVAPFAADLVVNSMYFQGNSSSATFRWDCSDYLINKDVEFALIIYASGEMDMYYRNYPTTPSAFYAGVYNHNGAYWELEYSSTAELPSNYKFRLTPYDYPKGMELSADGSFEGTPTENKTYSLNITVTDVEGMMRTKVFPFNVGGEGDTQAPTNPTGLSSSNITLTSTELNWNASTDNVGVTGYDIYQDGSLIGSSITTNYSVSDLICGTTYSFYTRAKDAADNVSGNSNTVSIIIPGCSDTEPPSAPSDIDIIEVTQTSITISWTASTDNTGVVGYDLYLDGSFMGTVTATTYTFTGLTCATTYNISIRAKDAAGNISVSGDVTATTSPCGCNYCSLAGTDQGYEWITGVAIGNFSKTSAKENGGYSDFTSETINLIAGESVSVTLTPNNTQYSEHFKIWIDYNGDCDFEDSGEEVLSGSAKGNTTGSINVQSGANGITRMRIAMQYNAAPPSECGTFQYGEVEDYTVNITEGGSDTQAPSIPTGLGSSNITQTGVNLNWAASSDNVGVTGYDVLQNGSVVESPGGTSVSITGLTAGTTYSFTVKAKDAANNTSAASSAISVTTPQASDTQAPTAPNNLATTGKSQISVNLSWTASTDNVEVTSYVVYNGTAEATTVSGTTATVGSLSAGNTYTFTVTAKDAAGNESSPSNALTVTTDIGGGCSNYCVPSADDQGYEWITGVTVGSFSKTSGKENGGYSDFTSEIINLNSGSSVSVTLTPNTTQYTEHFKVWIDYNADCDFDDAGEEVLSGSAKGNTTGTINIPSSASGITKMRVSMQYNAAPPTPCSTFQYGEIEDYSVNFGGTKATFANSATKVKVLPNPFIEIANIRFTLSIDSDVQINVYNSAGTQIKTLLNTNLNAGQHEIQFDGSEFPAGLYIYKIQLNNEILTGSLIKK